MKLYSEQYEAGPEYLTDKCWPHTYGPVVYDQLFEPIKDTVRNYLEIGTAYGGSILLARDYFLRSTIWGVDIISPNRRLRAKDADRIICVQGNAYKKQVSDMFINLMDIIIDDGSHTLEDQCTTIDLYLEKLSVGGLFIIEDVKVPAYDFEALDKTLDAYVDEKRGKNPWLTYETSTYIGPEYFTNSKGGREQEKMEEIEQHGELKAKEKDDNLYIIKRVK
tara:strand:+ start:2125 stop:2787 length:663 start_codon:yes stop_codon:yes gene_type:complete